MDKDIYDVLKPKWVIDSVNVGRLMPVAKRYFFFATSDRRLRGDYDDDDGDALHPFRSRAGKTRLNSEESDTESDDEGARALANATLPAGSEVDPPVEEAETAPDSETEDDTDPDSDFDDLGADEELGDDWLHIKVEHDSVGIHDDDEQQNGARSSTLESNGPDVEIPAAPMGETDDAMEYDQDLIFRHLQVSVLLFAIWQN